MNQLHFALMAVVLCMLALAPISAEEGDAARRGEPVRSVIDSNVLGMLSENARELNLTDEQKKQIEDYKRDSSARRTALEKDPQYIELSAKLRAARESRNEADYKEAARAVQERQSELLKPEKPLNSLLGILTADQKRALSELQSKRSAQRQNAEFERSRSYVGVAAKLLENSEELALTVDQKNQLSALKAAREKIESDAPLRVLFYQMRDVSNDLDDAKVRAVLEKIAARKTELGLEKEQRPPLDVLTEDQRKKAYSILSGRNRNEPERRTEPRREPERTEPRREPERTEPRREPERTEPRREPERTEPEKKELKEEGAPKPKIKPNNDE